jgi:limonene-1,2-epoxide hydrolase
MNDRNTKITRAHSQEFSRTSLSFEGCKTTKIIDRARMINRLTSAADIERGAAAANRIMKKRIDFFTTEYVRSENWLFDEFKIEVY